MATTVTPSASDLSAITAAASQYGVPLPFSLAIATQESGISQTNSSGGVLTSSSGAQGIYQLEPETAQGLGVDGTDEAQNIIGGNKYLGQLLKQFGGNEAAAADAYNAGGANVTAYGIDPSTWVTKAQGGSTGLTQATKNQAIAYLPAVTSLTQQYAAGGSAASSPNPLAQAFKSIGSPFGIAAGVGTAIGGAIGSGATQAAAGATAGASNSIIAALFGELTATGFTEKVTQFAVIALIIVGGFIIIVPRGATA